MLAAQKINQSWRPRDNDTFGLGRFSLGCVGLGYLLCHNLFPPSDTSELPGHPVSGPKRSQCCELGLGIPRGGSTTRRACVLPESTGYQRYCDLHGLGDSGRRQSVQGAPRFQRGATHPWGARCGIVVNSVGCTRSNRCIHAARLDVRRAEFRQTANQDGSGRIPMRRPAAMYRGPAT